jgi:hypothetical protein
LPLLAVAGLVGVAFELRKHDEIDCTASLMHILDGDTISVRRNMDKSTLIATSLTVLVVAGLVVYRLLWAASSVAAVAGLGRLSILPKGIRRRVFDERSRPSA